MREIIKSEEFVVFYEALNKNVQEKIKYVLWMMEILPVVNSKFVKKLTNTSLYEVRISVDNEYRVLFIACDSLNYVQSTKILLLNGFLKKSTKDYRAQIALAKRIIDKYYEEA